MHLLRPDWVLGCTCATGAFLPLDRQFPDDVGDVAEERDDEVGRGQVPDEQAQQRANRSAAKSASEVTYRCVAYDVKH